MGEKVRNKATFRAMRERVGMTRKTMAECMGVTVKSVKYWESPKSMRFPPDDAWDLLEDALDWQHGIIDYTLGKIEEMVDAAGGVTPDAIMLPYWLSADDYEENSGDSKYGLNGDWNMANANARVLEVYLESIGVRVKWTDYNPADPAPDLPEGV